MKLLMVLGDDISTEKAYMPSFIKSLDREKNIVKIVLKNDPELVRFICDMGFEVITVEHGRSVFTHGVVRELETIFEDEIPDAIHVFSEFWARTAAKAAYDMEVKIFATCQNSKEAMSVAKIKNISKIIVHSLAEKSELASKNIQNEKLAVIPQSAEPIDPISEKEKDRNREELGIEKTDIVFSVFARLE
ncbi:MAG: hypothetical protein U0M06_01985, partial [Clostridia bacterium]|nr:hypothetical protein [Clostridia bacterium]